MAESLVCAYDTNRIGHRQGGGKLILLGVGDYLTIPFQEGKLMALCPGYIYRLRRQTASDLACLSCSQASSFGRRQFTLGPTGDFRGLVH